MCLKLVEEREAWRNEEEPLDPETLVHFRHSSGIKLEPCFIVEYISFLGYLLGFVQISWSLGVRRPK